MKKSMNVYLKFLFVFNGILVFANGLLGPLYAVFVEGLDNDLFKISISWAVFQLATVIFLLLVRKYGDRIKNKIVLLNISFIIRILVWCCFIFVDNYYQLIFLQVWLGVAEALGSPTFQALLAEHLDDGKHLEEYSTWKLILYLATGVSALAGGLIVENFGFKFLFITMALLTIVAFIGLMTRVKDGKISYV